MRMGLRNRKGGALVTCLVVAVVVGLLGVVGVYYAYRKSVEALRSFAATAVEAGVQSKLNNLDFPKADKNAMMKPVKALAEKIRSGELESFGQGLQVSVELENRHVYAAITLAGFEYKYVKQSDLTDEEKTTAHKTIARVVSGLTQETGVSGSFAESLISEFSESVTTTDSNGITKTESKYKVELDIDALRDMLTRMKDAADKAKIEDAVLEVDLPGLIQEAVDVVLSSSTNG